MKKLVAVSLAVFLSCSSAMADGDCNSSVSSAQDAVRNVMIQGVSGLITNSFSSRPSSFTSMACLDKFMQGKMDIMFKPPSLSDLLGTVMNFACQSVGSGNSFSSSGLNLSSLLGNLSGGLNIGGSVFNLSGLFGNGSRNVNGGFRGIYSRP